MNGTKGSKDKKWMMMMNGLSIRGLIERVKMWKKYGNQWLLSTWVITNELNLDRKTVRKNLTKDLEMTPWPWPFVIVWLQNKSKLNRSPYPPDLAPRDFLKNSKERVPEVFWTVLTSSKNKLRSTNSFF